MGKLYPSVLLVSPGQMRLETANPAKQKTFAADAAIIIIIIINNLFPSPWKNVLIYSPDQTV